MKRAMFLVLAALAAIVALLVAVDAVNFETDRVDRWVMIFAFGGVAFFLGMATVDPGGSAAPADRTSMRASSRTSAQQSLATTRPRPAAEPPRPGSLTPTRARAGQSDPEPEIEIDVRDLDAVDNELQDIIDEEQMEEITTLVRMAEALERRPPPTDPIDPVDVSTAEDSPDATPAPTEEQVQEVVSGDEPETAVVERPAEPIARLELRLADYDDEALRRVVKDSEALVIAEMVRTGQLTSSGHLTERDIASMVFLAYTSDEMLAELRLRKALDQPGEVAVTDRALAPLKNIE